MGELGSATAYPLLLNRDIDELFPGQLAERQENSWRGEMDGCVEPAPAVGNFLCNGFVLRWCTMARICNHAVNKFEAIVSCC